MTFQWRPFPLPDQGLLSKAGYAASLHRLLDLKFRSRRIFEPVSAPQSPFPGKREFEAREFGALELT